MSKVEEINTVEKVERDKIYEVMYIMDMKVAMRLQPWPCGPDSNISRM